MTSASDEPGGIPPRVVGSLKHCKDLLSAGSVRPIEEAFSPISGDDRSITATPIERRKFMWLLCELPTDLDVTSLDRGNSMTLQSGSAKQGRFPYFGDQV
jgi:hypothetical protein